jgi:hypothetical protein
MSVPDRLQNVMAPLTLGTRVHLLGCGGWVWLGLAVFDPSRPALRHVSSVNGYAV